MKHSQLTTKQKNDYVDAVTHGERQIWKKDREIRVYYKNHNMLYGIRPHLNTTEADLIANGYSRATIHETNGEMLARFKS